MPLLQAGAVFEKFQQRRRVHDQILPHPRGYQCQLESHLVDAFPILARCETARYRDVQMQHR